MPFKYATFTIENIKAACDVLASAIDTKIQQRPVFQNVASKTLSCNPSFVFQSYQAKATLTLSLSWPPKKKKKEERSLSRSSMIGLGVVVASKGTEIYISTFDINTRVWQLTEVIR